jgi:hypothetical protein
MGVIRNYAIWQGLLLASHLEDVDSGFCLSSVTGSALILRSGYIGVEDKTVSTHISFIYFVVCVGSHMNIPLMIHNRVQTVNVFM